MALIKCPECGNDVSTEAVSCPKCGCPIKRTAEVQKAEEQYDTAAETYSRRNGGGCGKAIFVFVAIIVGLLLIGTCGGLSSRKSDNWNTENRAKSYAMIMVKDNLKAPSTAKFCNTSREMTAKNFGGAKWRVTGWVDAENSFGAMIRSDFDVVLELSSNGATRISCTIKKR